MSGLSDYVLWRGDLTMAERPFNEVDNLIFSCLAYLNFDMILASARKASVTLREVQQHVDASSYAHYQSFNDPRPLLKACAASARFGDVTVSDFKNTVDSDMQIQFSAVTFTLTDGTKYVAYRGTDNSIVGWREDFNFSFLEKTPAQAEAVKYLYDIIMRYDCPLRVGGHSKGGNLAVYAAAFCDDSDNVIEVYTNDGPGFNQYIYDQPDFQRSLPKIKSIIPENSLIGIILFNIPNKEIIKCSVDSGAQQHSPYTWLTGPESFVYADRQSSTSIMLDEILDRWVESIDEEQRRVFVSCIFDALEASGATTLNEINANRWIYYNAIIKAASGMSSEMKSSFVASLKKLGFVGKEVIWDETQKRFQPLKKGLKRLR